MTFHGLDSGARKSETKEKNAPGWGVYIFGPMEARIASIDAGIRDLRGNVERAGSSLVGHHFQSPPVLPCGAEVFD